MKKTICLNMIVKNESRVIRRCLASVKNLIDYWVIVDTGSTDGTQRVIQECLHDVPGELHERPFIDFAYNRNEAFAFARDKADYVLFIDADDRLESSPAFAIPFLNRDFYMVTYRHGSCNSCRHLLVKTRLNWQWVGVIHEELRCEGTQPGLLLNDLTYICGNDGNRSQNPRKIHKDIEALTVALQAKPDDTRYLFHLALAYDAVKEYSSALECYEKRATMGGFPEEIAHALYRIAWLQEELGMAPSIFIASYLRAYHYRPGRAEPLFHLANYFLKEQHFLLGHLISKFALSLPFPAKPFFLEGWIYEHGLSRQFSESARMVAKNNEARNISPRNS